MKRIERIKTLKKGIAWSAIIPFIATQLAFLVLTNPKLLRWLWQKIKGLKDIGKDNKSEVLKVIRQVDPSVSGKLQSVLPEGKVGDLMLQALGQVSNQAVEKKQSFTISRFPKTLIKQRLFPQQYEKEFIKKQLTPEQLQQYELGKRAYLKKYSDLKSFLANMGVKIITKGLLNFADKMKRTRYRSVGDFLKYIGDNWKKEGLKEAEAKALMELVRAQDSPEQVRGLLNLIITEGLGMRTSSLKKEGQWAQIAQQVFKWIASHPNEVRVLLKALPNLIRAGKTGIEELGSFLKKNFPGLEFSDLLYLLGPVPMAGKFLYDLLIKKRWSFMVDEYLRELDNFAKSAGTLIVWTDEPAKKIMDGLKEIMGTPLPPVPEGLPSEAEIGLEEGAEPVIPEVEEEEEEE